MIALATTWPEAFESVGVTFAIVLMIWVMFR